ncbi:unnamed protein product [Bursaphelenchus okinawaensis]|uniref:G-protein coupled receptors family 1 profile domain-containing protein n=1 Tax=Bursaphelenchus okinawaensis TaxID=465554 RepID=A0A811LRE7_9BILA|nr:unnamed protein product [Bursaphelenchus okinawaensis]CAG9127093.1 unnamed protein product [Bursaphelenchus okinawaensis]
MDEVREPPKPLFSDYIEMVYLGMVILIGVPLNINVFRRLVLEMRKTPRHSVKRSFLLLKVNLNISDLLILLVHALGKFLWLATYEWKGGVSLCRIFNFLSMFTLYLSSNIIVCIAFDRLRTVLAANKIQHGKNQTFCTHSLICCGWMFAVIWSLPQLYVWRTVNAFKEHPGGWIQCTDIWAINDFHLDTEEHRNDSLRALILREESKDFYNLSHLVFVFYGPLVMLMVCYIIIVMKIMHYNVKNPAVALKSEVQTTLKPYDELSTYREKRLSSTRSLLDLNSNSHTSPNRHRHSAALITTLKGFRRHDEDVSLALESVSLNESFIDEKPSNLFLIRWFPCLRGTESKTVRSVSPIFSSTPPFGHPEGTESLTTFRQEKVKKTKLSPITGWRRHLKSRVFRTTLLIIVAHVLFWLPYNLYALIKYINEDLHLRMNEHANVFKELQFVIAIINPFLYGFTAQ